MPTLPSILLTLVCASLAACDQPKENPTPESADDGLFNEQIQSLEKAKQVEHTLQESAKQRRAVSEE